MLCPQAACLVERVGLISSFFFANPHSLGVSFVPEKENMSRRVVWCLNIKYSQLQLTAAQLKVA